MPQADNAVVHLAAAVENWEVSGTGATEQQLRCVISSNCQRSRATRLPNGWRALEQPERADLAAKHLSEESPMWNSMLRDSIAPTMLQAGVRVNVIPSEARGQLGCALLPGHFHRRVDWAVRKIVNDPQSISTGARFG